MSLWIDSLLAVLAVFLAVRCLLAPTLPQCVFLFFAFGLTLALAWARLGAVDVAIAEAAIAAGFLGVLLIDALRDFSRSRSTGEGGDRPSRVSQGLVGAGVLVFLVVAIEAVWRVPNGGGLTALAADNLPQSGVDHPVTAVLLNYRSYDTWLEVGVVLMALLALFATGGREYFCRPVVRAVDPLLRQVILLFTPVLFLVGAFLLYLGKTEPGGAFQAAVLWGAGGILLHLGGWPVFASMAPWLRHLLLTAGFGFFLLLGFLFMAGGGALFEYPLAQAGLLILVVETLAALSIAAALTAIFAYFNGMSAESAEPFTPASS
ncbi:MAG: Na(+)/H(+) antiporter subunit B [Opitutales bacterium]|nr:Na(+)/H(+) antiporter subunit B [Opitutales bacterium]